MPFLTVLIVGGSWVILLALTIWSYRRSACRGATGDDADEECTLHGDAE